MSSVKLRCLTKSLAPVFSDATPQDSRSNTHVYAYCAIFAYKIDVGLL